MSQLGFKLSFWNWISLLLKLFPKLKSKKGRKRARRIFLLQLRALRLTENTLLPQATFPKIELLSVASEKDLEVLALCLKSAIRFSLNPISKVIVICPSFEVEKFTLELSRHKIHDRVEILDEDKILSQEFRAKVKHNFGSRYGWVLQQFLSLEYILQTSASGVLMTNADTIQLRKVHWLSDNCNQVLMASTEYHDPYYELLSHMFGFRRNPKFSFVTHHMLFQPKLLRSIFGNHGYYTVMEILDAAIQYSNSNEPSPLCIEFEPYAQGLLNEYPEYVFLKKLANKEVSRTDIDIELTVAAYGATPRYNSISLHDYL